VLRVDRQDTLEHLGVAVEHLPLGVLIVDAAGDLIFANSAARRLLRPVKLRANAPLPDVWPDFSLRDLVERVSTRGTTVEERVAVAPDRTYALRGVGGRGTATVILLLEDVSRDERRRRAEREFVANAAHELLTPLTGIVGAAHVLEAGAKDVPEDREKFLAHIAKECSRLSRIARSLLVLARAQSGEEPPRLEILNLRELLDEVAADTSGDVSVACSASLTVFTDADLFAQAASNLRRNAVRHGGGAVTVEAQHVSGAVVQVDIRDGSVHKAEFKQLRGRFRSPGGRDGGGFGLGLSIAEQSLDVVGANLTVVAGGTRIELPAGEVSD